MERVKFILLVSLILIFNGCMQTQSSISKLIIKQITPSDDISDLEKLTRLTNYLINKESLNINDYTKKEIEDIVKNSMTRAYSFVYGKPYLDNDLVYDFKMERFKGFIKSTKGDFNKEVFIDVPKGDVAMFKASISSLRVNIILEYENSMLSIKNINLESNTQIYSAKLKDKSNDSTLVSLSIPNFRTTNMVTKKREIKAGDDDIGEYLRSVKSTKDDNTKWLFIIAVENYEYTDSVIYSANSARQFKSVMKKRFGIPEKNIRALIDKDATSGKIRYNLKDMVAHVKPGDTIYFYYSGHGIPVPSQKNAPYLLAQDMSPQYVADDDRFKLQNIYKTLSNSKASKIVAFVDSCFSGGTDNQALIKGVAATRMVPKKVTFNKEKMLVISAGSGIQYSNKFDEKKNRLFSYYIMRGLINNNTDSRRLYDYVKSNVQEKSYEMGASYEQVPVYDGDIGLNF